MKSGKISKKEAVKKIENFFNKIDKKNTNKENVRKIKKMAMKNSIRLENKRKKFCKYCYSPNLKIKTIKNNMKTIECNSCGKLSRWKIKEK